MCCVVPFTETKSSEWLKIHCKQWSILPRQSLPSQATGIDERDVDSGGQIDTIALENAEGKDIEGTLERH